jgi:hypothetical protein
MYFSVDSDLVSFESTMIMLPETEQSTATYVLKAVTLFRRTFLRQRQDGNFSVLLLA